MKGRGEEGAGGAWRVTSALAHGPLLVNPFCDRPPSDSDANTRNGMTKGLPVAVSLLVAVASLAGATGSRGGGGGEQVVAGRLENGVELVRQRLVSDGRAQLLFKVGLLEPEAKYEVRVSYSATQPTDFELDVVDLASKEAGAGTGASGAGAEDQKDLTERTELRRRRLNTDRLHVWTDGRGKLLAQGEALSDAFVRVRAKATGVRPPGKRVPPGEGEVLFNIVLEQMVGFGVLPQSSLRMVCWGVLCLLAGRFLVAPTIDKLVRDSSLKGTIRHS